MLERINCQSCDNCCAHMPIYRVGKDGKLIGPMCSGCEEYWGERGEFRTLTGAFPHFTPEHEDRCREASRSIGLRLWKSIADVNISLVGAFGMRSIRDLSLLGMVNQFVSEAGRLPLRGELDYAYPTEQKFDTVK